MEDMMTVCPKCGHIGCNYDEDEHCLWCETKLADFILTDVTLSKFLLTIESQEKYKKHIHENYLFNNPLFNKESFNYRETKQAENRKKSREDGIKRKEQEKNNPTCPKCGSTALSANKKGFGLGKAVAGGLITGGAVGLLGGFIGSNKVEVTCINCGHKFIAGKK